MFLKNGNFNYVGNKISLTGEKKYAVEELEK